MVQGSKYEALADDSLAREPVNTTSIPVDHVHCKKHGVWCRIKKRFEPVNSTSVPVDDVHCKKHGVWCRIKKRFKLKKRSQGKSKEADHVDVCCEKNHLIAAVSTDSVYEEHDKSSYIGQTVHIAVVSDQYTLLEEVAEDNSALPSDRHILDSVSVASDEENYDFVINRGDKQANIKHYLSKRWHSKSAKRVRKGIRGGTRNSFKYLQTATSNIPNIFPDATTFASAVSQQQRQQRYR